MRFEKGKPTPARVQLAADAARLRKKGMTQKEIAAELNCARSYVAELLSDPAGEKARARKDSYRGICENCGASTNSCNGPGKASKLCASCHTESIRAEHGTRSRYHGGCRCDDCRTAKREYMRTLQGQPAPNHATVSGYVNYGCRCEPCKAAYSRYQWLHPEYQRRWRAKQKKKAA